MDNESDIAIIGMACRFPGAGNLEEFWKNLMGGVESIVRLSDQEMMEAGVLPEVLSGPNYVKAAAVLDDPGRFDAGFFGFSPNEAAALDPQHRLMLELSQAALDDAGCDPDRFPGQIGVFAGAAMNTYFMNSGQDARFAEEYIPTLILNDKDFLATRISYKLGLRGPSMTVQTACSTSLVCVHLARQSLLNEETDMAVVGAVSVRVPHRAGYFCDGGGVVSPDGHVRAFDAGANGTVFGSGAGVIVMRRLEDALAHGDRIHAVIKGSAINNDGSAKAGYTAPSVNGQADVVVEALANAGVDAESISYVEAHGSGTPVGDPIEILALTKAFRNFTQRKGFCAIGSVKTNVGHLDVAAGMAGLIKTVLALKHRRIPSTLHYSNPNPEIDFPATPFFVNAAAVKWAQRGGPRRAGVMATGMGGTNAHVVLEEAPAVAPTTDSPGPHLLVLSAKTPSVLDSMSRNLSVFLASPASGLRAAGSLLAPGATGPSGDPPGSSFLADVAHTLQAGRRFHPCRRFVVCRDTAQAVAALKTADAKKTAPGPAREAPSRPVVFMLPGIGDHYVGMGEGLYEHFDAFRREIDRCAQILQPLLGLDVRELLYPPHRVRRQPAAASGIDLKRMLGLSPDETVDPASQKLEQTIHSQPALFTLEYALARLWLHWGVQPERLVGHSMGEYVAACLAGVFSLEDAVRLVAVRAKLVNSLPLGSMLAVTLPEDQVLPLMGEKLSISLINGPSLCVVAGPVADMADFQVRLQEREIVFRKVRNGHAFHSRMLDPIIDAFAREVRQVRLNPPRIPFISNVTGTWISSEQALDPQYWCEQARRTARFSSALEELWKIPDCLPLEVGPGRTLGVLAMQHPARSAAANATTLSSLRHDYENQPDPEFIFNTVGRLWVAGTEIDWEKLNSNPSRQKVSLPTYPFEGNRHWIHPRVRATPPAIVENPPGHKADLADWFYVPSWERTVFPTANSGEDARDTHWLIIGDPSDLANRFRSALEARGAAVTFAGFGDSFADLKNGSYEIRPSCLDDYVKLLGALRKSLGKALNILHLGALSARVGLPDTGYDPLSQELGFYSLMDLAIAIGEVNIEAPVSIGVVTRQIHEVTGDEILNPAMATVLGPCGAIPEEFPNVSTFSVDLPSLPSTNRDPEELVGHLLCEFRQAAKAVVIAYRGKYRWQRTFKPCPLPAPALTTPEESLRAQGLRPRGVYLIVGGTGGLGLEIGKYLAANCQARLILTRKKPFPEESIWRDPLAAGNLSRSDQQIVAALLEIEALGGTAEVLTCDASDKAGMQRVVAATINKHQVINGVIHAAGIVREGMIQLKTREVTEAVLAPKVNGAFILYELIKNIDLDILVMFSSIAAVLPRHGESDYRAANSFLDAFSYFASSQGRFRTLTINWSGWREIGMLTGLKPLAGLEKQRAAALKNAILTSDGLEAFKRALTSRLPQVIVSPRELETVVAEDRRMLLESFDSVARAPIVTANGERAIDGARTESENAMDAPRTTLERTLTGIWIDLFGLADISIHDDFFALGGHSLLAVRLFSKIHQLTGQKLPLATLLEASTIDELAGLISEGRK